MRLVLSVLFAVLLGVSVVSPAAAASSAPSAPSASVVCSEGAPSECDVDLDRIPDTLEVQVCGSATCATGREDVDADGIPDWVEFRACETAECADSAHDIDADGIPNFAERLTCGSESCSSGREDADTDNVTDWIEFVICGDRFCANGSEDYDADGVPDAKQLAACIVRFDVVTIGRWWEDSLSVAVGSTVGVVKTTPHSGWVRPPVSVSAGPAGVIFEFVWWPIWVGAILTALGMVLLGLALWAQRRRDATPDDDVETDEVVVAELLGLDQGAARAR